MQSEDAAIRPGLEGESEAVPEGSTTVGSSVELTHEAPTPLGGRVRAHARLEEVVGGKRLRFSFTVRDQAGRVASGTHLRVVVRRAEFEAAAEARRSSRA